jgi:hypothetical protein
MRLVRENRVWRGPALQVEARQPPRNIDDAVAATGPVPIDEHNSTADEAEIVTSDIAVHQVVTSQLRGGFCRHEGINGVAQPGGRAQAHPQD